RRKDIHDQALVVPRHSKVHCPLVFRRPVPVQYILSSAPEPIPLDLFPELVALFCERTLIPVAVLEVFTNADQSLCKKRSFDQVCSIVPWTKRFDFTRFTVHPVRPRTVEAVGLLQPVHELF